MPIPASGAISLQTVATEFGGSTPHSLSEYYAGGGLVPAGTSGTHGAVPSSGAISLRNFYGTSNTVYMTATGGTETTSGSYKIHTFTGNGTFTVTNAGFGYPEAGTVEYLVVAGGGGGWPSALGNGGGGAGGYRTSTGFPVTATGYPITVGGGGGSTSPGSNSSFSSITSNGGGRGSRGGGETGEPGRGGPGGSGGGGGGNFGPFANVGGSGTPGQGNPGGTGQLAQTEPWSYYGGGGGGAGGAGGTLTAGAGSFSSISGSPVQYSRGGQGQFFGEPTSPGGTIGAGGGGFAQSGSGGTVIIRYRYQA